MTANLRTLTKEKRELPMKKLLMPATALATMKKLAFAIFCATLLMLVATPAAAADICSTAFGVNGCGVTITITGTSGHLIATIQVTDAGPYDGVEDQLVGITNNSSAFVGAIVLSGPTGDEGLFGFDGDGPCVRFETLPCGSDPFDYQGPNNTFVGISPDHSSGKVLFTTPLAPNGGTASTTWFALEETPTSVVAIGENKALTAGKTTIFPFGPFSTTDGVTFTEAVGPDDYRSRPGTAPRATR